MTLCLYIQMSADFGLSMKLADETEYYVTSLKDLSDRDGLSLLDAPLEAVREPARAAQLGAPLSWAQDLYTDLQQYYQ